MSNNDLAFLDEVLSQAATSVARAQETTAERLLQLTQEEEEELRNSVLRQFANSTSTPTTQEEHEDEEEESEEESAEETAPHNPEPEIPNVERPVIIPDYSQVRAETTRFSGAAWFSKVQEQTIILAGVGGIGSNMAIILAKLNPAAIYVFDDDVVESVNIAGQFYSKSDVGKFKVNALCENVVNFTNYSTIYACNRRYWKGESIVGDIMVCGFDNMTARNEFYHAWKEHVGKKTEEEKKKCLFLDGRLTANELQIFCITGEDTYYMEQYERKHLFKDYQAQELPCSFKQTGFMAQMIGSLMTNLLVNFCANLVSKVPVMSLPFLTSYKSDIMYLSMER